MAEMSKAKVTPRAKHPERTQLFAATMKEALDAFKEEISLPDEDVRSGAFQKLLDAYKHALEPVWNLAHLAGIDIILKTVSDREMLQLGKMAKQLQPAPTTAKVIKETPNIPSLEMILMALKDKLPSENLPNTQTCAKIGDVFNKIHCAHKAYADAAEGLVELSTEVTPQQYTMLLTAAIMPTIQIIVPNQLISPLTAPPPPQLPASTALGRSEIIKFTKLKVLPNPDASALTTCDENSATRILAVAVYCKLEHLFFDKTFSHADVAMAFRCNVSQLTKAITGVDYKGGPHHYRPKQKTGDKRSRSSTGPSQQATKKPKTKAAQASTSKQASTSTSQEKQPSQVVSEDTLLESSSSSDLPVGLLQ